MFVLVRSVSLYISYKYIYTVSGLSAAPGFRYGGLVYTYNTLSNPISRVLPSVVSEK